MNAEKILIPKPWQKARSRESIETSWINVTKIQSNSCENAPETINENNPFDVNHLLPSKKRLKILCNASTTAKTEKSLIISQWNKTVEADQSPLLLLFDKISAQEFVPIPKEKYVKNTTKGFGNNG